MRWPIVLRRVVGSSMVPTLFPGSLVFARSWFKNIQENDLVIIAHDGLEKIKRVKAVKDTEVFVVGDNPKESKDSRQLGWLPFSSIKAKVFFITNT